MEKQKTPDTKTILYNKGTSGGITMPDLKLYYRTIWYCHETDRWINGIELKAQT